MALLTDRKFIHFNRKSDFEALLNANAISDKQIVFLKDAQEIWTHGTYYGSVEQFLDETNKDSTNAISAAAVYKALADDEKVIAAALNDLNDRIENLDIPSKVSDLTDDLSLATLDYVDDKLDDVLGISASGVEAFVNMTRDEDTATGILTEIVNKAPKTNAVNGAPLSNAESYFYGTSTTATYTVLKEVSIPSITSLKTGQIIVVKPTITSTVANSTIKLNNFTAYPMRYNNAAITTSTNSIVWAANIPSIWVFDGTYWVFLGHGLDSNTTYSAMTQAEIDAGTSTTARLITPKLLRDNFYTETESDTNFAKVPLVIEVNDIDTEVPSGTYASITAALAAGREVVVKVTMTEDDEEIFYLNFVIDYSQADTNYYFNTVQYLSSYDFSIDVADQCSFNKHNIADAEHYHGNITDRGDITATAPTIANGDQLVINDHSASKITNGPTFDGSTTTKALTPKGTWETFLQNHQSIKSLNTNNTSAQTVNASEAIAGTGTINLHKVSKTGSYSDLIKPSGGIPSTDFTSAVLTSLGKADTAIQGVKVNGTALTPDTNKVVDVTIPTNVSDLTNDLNFVRRYNLLDQSVLLLGDENQWYENSELNTPEIVFKLNQTHDNILLGEFYPTLIYSKLPHVSGSDFYPNTALGLISYITANLGEFSGYYDSSSVKPNWRTGWGVIPTVDLAFDNGNEDINIVPGISMTFVGVLDRGAIGQGTHYIAICYNSIYRNYNFELKIFYDLELQRLHATQPFVLNISDLGEVNTIETIKVNNIALTPDANKAVNITIPEGELSTNYEPSSLENEDLELAAGDTYEEAFGKLEKSINDNEQITAAALTDLDSRINTLHLPQSLDDIPDGSTRKLSDYATTILLATKQNALVSGTNIKTINNESILGSGNISIEDNMVILPMSYNGSTRTYNFTWSDITSAYNAGKVVIVRCHDTSDNLAIDKDYIIAEVDNMTIYLVHYYEKKYEAITLRGSNDEIVEALYVSRELQSKLTFDEYPDENSSNPVTSAGIALALSEKQDTLVSGTNIKTINNQSLLGSGNITIQGGSGGDTNVIETVKVNGTALTPDANKAVDITSIPASIVTQDATHRFVSDTEKTTWNNKVSNVQADWNATSGLAQILNKPTIPAAVTESTVAGWGFTKNTGTVTGVKMNGTTNNPTNGIVDLGTVLTSFTETDPTVPAWAKTASKPTYTAAEVGALPDTYTPPVTSVNGQTGAVNLTIPSAPGTLNTTATTAQSTSSSEALSGNITLHKVAKTGTYNDLIGTPNLSAYVIDYGSSGVGKIHGNVSEIEETRLYAASTTGAYVAVTPGGVDIDTTSLLSFGDISVTTRTGAKLKYNNNEVATVNQIPTVNNATLTIQKNGTTVNTFTANASSNVTANIQVNELPTVSSSDNGKILMVVNGAWTLVTPTSIYSGTSEPDSNTGNNGDLYLQTS